MGAIFEVPLARVDDDRRAAAASAIALVADAGEPLRGLRDSASAPAGSRCWSAPSATACPRRSLAACEHVAHIPIAGESLNAAMAATMALYETDDRRPLD